MIAIIYLVVKNIGSQVNREQKKSLITDVEPGIWNKPMEHIKIDVPSMDR